MFCWQLSICSLVNRSVIFNCIIIFLETTALDQLSPIAIKQDPTINRIYPITDCMSQCVLGDNLTMNHLSAKILVFGGSTFVGSSITLHLHKQKFKVIPIETEDIYSFSASQYHNWQQLASEGLDPLIIQQAEIKSAFEKFGYVNEIIYIPRHIISNAGTILKEEGVAELEYLVNLLEVVKDQPTRLTLITKYGIDYKSSSSMQSVWLSTLEITLKAYYRLLKIAIIRLDGYYNELENIDYNDLLKNTECIIHNFNTSCFDLRIAITTEKYMNHSSVAAKNIQQKNAVMSTYFTTVINPQYNVQFSSNSFRFMNRWLMSSNRLGIHAVIFHDSLSDDYIERVKENFDNVVFHKVTNLHGRTPNDYRYYLYYNYLQKHPEISNVIMSDIRDVMFLNDPFEIMEVIGTNAYVGIDIYSYTDAWNHKSLYKRINDCYPKEINSTSVKAHPFYNAGVLGGTRQIMLKYLELLTESLDATPPLMNCNMAAVAIVTHKFFGNQSFAGYPFQSGFKLDIPGIRGLACDT